jgi:hypothetical protein
MCRKAKRNHFLDPRHRKKRHGRSPLSKVLGRRTVLRTNNLPSGRVKKKIREVDEAKFQVVEGSCELIFCIQGIEKSDLDDDA